MAGYTPPTPSRGKSPRYRTVVGTGRGGHLGSPGRGPGGGTVPRPYRHPLGRTPSLGGDTVPPREVSPTRPPAPPSPLSPESGLFRVVPPRGGPIGDSCRGDVGGRGARGQYTTHGPPPCLPLWPRAGPPWYLYSPGGPPYWEGAGGVQPTATWRTPNSPVPPRLDPRTPGTRWWSPGGPAPALPPGALGKGYYGRITASRAPGPLPQCPPRRRAHAFSSP